MKTELEKIEARGYSRGYQAGRKGLNEAKRIAYNDGVMVGRSGKQNAAHTQRYDSLMTHALNSALQHCNGWTVKGKTINDGDGYVQIAKVFVDNIIRTGPKF